MIEKLKKLLEEAVKMLYETDYDLISAGYERAIVPHIFCNIKQLIENTPEYAEFRHYNVDNEYERHGENEKRIDTNKCARPDIILHKRGTDDNLFVIEFKTANHANNENIEMDKEKLQKFTSSDTTSTYYYHYKLGVLVKLDTHNIECSYFENGYEVDNITMPIVRGASNE